MEFFMKKIFDGSDVKEAHRHFVRFGKGHYKRRFLMNLNKGNKVKIRSSFELANEFVQFVRENKDLKFSGKVLTKKEVPGKTGRKKAGSFVYEISESSLEEFENVYFYLLNANDSDIVLKIKKAIPKPGKSEDKIDDKFCSLDLDVRYWDKIKETFFWDLPDNLKKASIEHEIIVNEIVLPENEENPVKMRELAKRKGKIIRKIVVDDQEKISEKDFEA